MSQGRTVWVLQTDKGHLAVYSSMKSLSKGVDYWMKEYPRSILSYVEHQTNYSPEPLSWGWCYVPLNTKTKRLLKGGASFIPMKKWWGFNLVGLDIRGVETHYEVK